MYKYLIVLCLSFFIPLTFASEAGQRCIDLVVTNTQDWPDLLLNGCSIDDSDIPTVLNVLREHPNYKNLYLDSNNITIQGVKLLIDVPVNLLNLSNNSIGPLGAAELAKSTTITHLWLDNCALSDAGVIALSRNTHFTALHIAQNNISSRGARAVAQNTNLTEVDISNNPVGDAGIKEFANDINLTMFIANNCRIGNPGVIALAVRDSITWLELSDNHIGDRGAYALADQQGTPNKAFILLHNRISSAGVAALKSNSLIKTLCVNPGDCW